MEFPELNVRLPEWLPKLFQGPERVYPSIEERMGLVIELARLNVEKEKAGPFAAAVFEMRTGKLVAPGVNLVLQLNCAILHAEMVAIAMAQKILGTYDLGGPGMPAHEIVINAEPCAMCLGAIPWSGVRRLVCGARDEDARIIGFDEGDKPFDWALSLKNRGIYVVQDMLREEAISVLEEYQSAGGIIYNSRRGSPPAGT